MLFFSRYNRTSTKLNKEDIENLNRTIILDKVLNGLPMKEPQFQTDLLWKIFNQTLIE